MALCRCHTAFCTLPDRYGRLNGSHAREAGPQLDEGAALHTGCTKTQSGEDEAKACGKYAGFELADHHSGVEDHTTLE